MARAARPLNPDEGPVQAFAFDLRVLREAAGNPTYRTLAKAAGYSASTLGEAAGGVRFPTLDVILAYVGACGGDAEHWRERWQAVNRELAGQQGAAGVRQQPAAEDVGEANGGTEDQASSTPPPPVAPRNSFLTSRRASWLGVALLGVVVAVVASVVLRQPASAGSSGSAAGAVQRRSSASSSSMSVSATPPLGCPGPAPNQPRSPGSFLGLTYGPGANVRVGASTSAPVVVRLPPGCTVRFSGYCLGDVVQDATSATPDMRWFILPGQGEVASAVVHGDPPESVPPQQCPDSVAGPSSISLSVSAAESGGGVVDLTAKGVRLRIVGFAAYYGTGSGGASPKWHQLGMTTATAGSFNALLRTALVADAPASRGIPVVAAACLGGNGATDVAASGSVEPGRGFALTADALAAADLRVAEQTACQYPSGG
jgi:hypothetical protein